MPEISTGHPHHPFPEPIKPAPSSAPNGNQRAAGCWLMGLINALEATMELGYCEGDTCCRDGCEGVIESHDVENCSCHLNAPCGSCTSPRGFCPECDWQESEDPPPPPESYMGKPWTPPPPRPLDPTKVDWRSASHSSCSMIKEGVYPLHMDRADVEKEVLGTFGGRFERFGNGHFKYIAYTD